MITGTGYDDLEVYYAYYRLMEEGYEIDIAASQKGLVTGVHSQIEAMKRTKNIMLSSWK